MSGKVCSDKIFCIEPKHALYLYGSEYRNQSIPTSDVDLMLITENLDVFKTLLPKLAEKLISKKPEWKFRKLDFRFITLTDTRSPKAAEVIGLAELWQQPRAPLMGDDLVKVCYQPTWKDYRLAVIGQIMYANQQIVQPPLEHVLATFKKAGTIKRIYTLQYYLSLFASLEKHPGKYFFSAADLQDPDFVKVRTVVREGLHYKFPTDPTSTEQLVQIFSNIKQKTTTLLQNLKWVPE